MPDDVADIPSALEKLRKQLVAINVQRDAILGAIKSIQKHSKAMCSSQYDL